MKKIIALILAVALVMAFAACGTKKAVNNEENDIVTENQTENLTEEKAEDKEVKEETKKEDKKEPVKEETKQEKPAEKPVEEPAEKPQEKPEVKPQAPKTLGNILLADFKAKANSGMSAEAIANALITNPEIKFAGGAMPVEPGLLSGFDNAEITGFKSGYVFMPMIGSIPFIGYVFELPNAGDASSFIANLQKNANLRWNICVAADEMVTGSAGNKVFFVMCPESLEE